MKRKKFNIFLDLHNSVYSVLKVKIRDEFLYGNLRQTKSTRTNSWAKANKYIKIIYVICSIYIKKSNEIHYFVILKKKAVLSVKVPNGTETFIPKLIIH